MKAKIFSKCTSIKTQVKTIIPKEKQAKNKNGKFTNEGREVTINA